MYQGVCLCANLLWSDLEYYHRLAQDHLQQAFLIYGGDQYQTRSIATVLP
jgi:hypothetical protein